MRDWSYETRRGGRTTRAGWAAAAVRVGGALAALLCLVPGGSGAAPTPDHRSVPRSPAAPGAGSAGASADVAHLRQHAPEVGAAPAAAAAGDTAYYVYVAGESEDRVDLVRLAGGALEVVETVPVGRFPTEIDGPHGLAMAADGSRWYVSLAHGNPFGAVFSYSTADNRPLGLVELGLFPASLHAGRAGLLFVSNFNLHGDHAPSTISVVDGESLTEIVQIPTCAMPHGSRLTPDGTLHYSVCMMDDQLVEIDARRLRISRRFSVVPGREGPLPAEPGAAEAAHGAATRGVAAHGAAVCSPTWAHPSPDARFVYVTCNRNRQVLEVDAERWEMSRRFATGAGPYNLDVTPDGRLLVVTYKGGRAVGVWDLERGEEAFVVETTRRLPHGIAITPDSRYAFISVEGVGGEPGALDVIDLRRGGKVASIDVGKQAAGIVFWKSKPHAE